MTNMNEKETERDPEHKKKVFRTIGIPREKAETKARLSTDCTYFHHKYLRHFMLMNLLENLVFQFSRILCDNVCG